MMKKIVISRKRTRIGMEKLMSRSEKKAAPKIGCGPLFVLLQT